MASSCSSIPFRLVQLLRLQKVSLILHFHEYCGQESALDDSRTYSFPRPALVRTKIGRLLNFIDFILFYISSNLASYPNSFDNYFKQKLVFLTGPPLQNQKCCSTMPFSIYDIVSSRRGLVQELDATMKTSHDCFNKNSHDVLELTTFCTKEYTR